MIVEPRREARRSTLALLAASLRPEHWTKNLLLFAGLVFGGRLREPDAVLAALAAFVIFCALSGALYMVNDISDRDADRRHPLKQARPIASGALPTATAGWTAGALVAGATAGAWALGPMVAAVAAAYALLLLLYSTTLKHIVIVDVLVIAGGFVLRAVAGAIAVDVPIGSWLLACTTLLALFLALSKRRHELVLLGDGAVTHRPSLEDYSPYLLDQMIAVVTASTVIAYTVFATSTDTAERLGTPRLGFTIPFVLYGIFRYLYLVHQKRGGGSPTALLLTDRPLLACVVLWGTTVVALMYSPLGH
ncbi:MAG: decaprenyl-phosphate phosphoribosyltransferase [Acidobacteria bacterium]|nr:decaprenyl-phosphate phosphoribosyltransferase [Acidobacteriota bacterium]